MKKLKTILTLTLFFLAAFTVYGQTEKGNFLIGGSSSLGLNFATAKTEFDGNSFEEDQKITNFTFQPDVGYFIIDNLAVGLSLPISINTSDFDDRKNTTTAILASVFSRYYFTESNIKPFIQGQIGFGNSNTNFESRNGESESKSNLFNFGAVGGVAIFLNNIISIDLGIVYSNSTSSPGDSDFDIKTKTNQFGFNAGFAIIL